MTFSFISEQTGFDFGEKWATAEEIRDYFTLDNMCSMFGENCDVSDETMKEMADAVISNRWHCEDGFGVEFVGCDVESLPLDIRAELKTATKIELLGKHEHPEHPGSNDWTVTLYWLEGEKGGTQVAATNGDSVWPESDPQEFADLMESYGIK